MPKIATTKPTIKAKVAKKTKVTPLKTSKRK